MGGSSNRCPGPRLAALITSNTLTLAGPLLTSLSGPLGQAPWGLCSHRDPRGLTQSHAHGGAHTQPSCKTNSNSLHGAPPHTVNRWDTDTLGSWLL